MPVRNLSELATNSLRRKALEALNTSLISMSPKNVLKDASTSLFKEIPEGSSVKVFGIGKAAETMYQGFREVFSSRISSAFLIIPEDEEFKSQFPELTVLRGTHPLPSELTLKSSTAVLEELKKCSESDTVVFLISGGGSSLFEVPEEGLSIGDIANTAKCVMDSGASISELNTIRIAMSAVKGGKLLDCIKSGKIYALYISDVISNDLHFIASGPLIPYSWTGESDSVVEKYRKCIGGNAGNAIARAGKVERKDDKTDNRIVLSNENFVNFISLKLETDKKVLNLGHTLQGDVEQLSKSILSRLRAEAQKRKSDFWFVGAGESTVNVRGNGEGGRNQELCLHVLRNLRPEEKVLFISAGTDGIDGQSPAMGGVVDHETLEDSSVDEMVEYIDRNDSYTFLSEHNGAIISGRTGNNVSDIMLGHYATWNNRY